VELVFFSFLGNAEEKKKERMVVRVCGVAGEF
jgi:hypothetical protein